MCANILGRLDHFVKEKLGLKAYVRYMDDMVLWHDDKKVLLQTKYFLRTTLDETQESTLWSIYNIIREIESTFRVLKTDLDLRPIYHKTDDASMAHLNLGLFAYWLVATIRFQLKQKGFTHSWSEIVRIMNTQKCVSTSMENIEDKLITIRQCTEPTKKAKQIYQLLNYKSVPFYRKKSVVPPVEIFKNDSS